MAHDIDLIYVLPCYYTGANSKAQGTLTAFQWEKKHVPEERSTAWTVVNSDVNLQKEHL